MLEPWKPLPKPFSVRGRRMHMLAAKRLWLSGVLLLVMFSGTSLYGATWYAGEFLSVGVGPRAIGMGSAVVAIAEGADAPYWNPAGLSRTKATIFAFEHAERFAGIVVHDALTGAVPLHSGTLGILLFRGAVDGIIFADSTVLADPSAPLSQANMPDPTKVRAFSNTDYLFLVAYGRAILSNLHVGAGIKLIRRSIDRTGAFGCGLDLGAQWNLTPHLVFGLTVRDASTTRVSWDNGHTDVVYPSVHVGSAYTMLFPERSARLTIAAGSVFGSGNAGYGGFAPWQVGDSRNPGVLGAEFSWHEIAMIRVGTQDLRGVLGPGSGQLTAGFGIHTALPWVANVRRFGVDLTWMRHTLRDSYRLGAVVQL